ncbi:MAG TPA: hypothetical protein VFJ06_14435 [Halococcus sp.]|nr:hypothetical protein [Halococcus sp.]
MSFVSSVLSALRRPEHTGERRCWPCTLLNGVLLALAVVAVARTRRRALAICLGVVGTATIALRGYLVPYTPLFAPRFAARLPGDPFHLDDSALSRLPDGPATLDGPQQLDGPDVSGSLSDEGPDGEAVLAALLDAGILTTDGESLVLTDDARARWRAEMCALRGLEPDALSSAIRAVAPTADATIVTDDEQRWVVLTDETGEIGRGVWLSWPVAIAETAAVRAFADELDPETAIGAARPLRMFLEICPVCDEPVHETTTLDCCGGLSTPKTGPQDVLACEACDEWLFTFPPTES